MIARSEAKYWEIVDGLVAPLMRELGFEQQKKGWFYSEEKGCTRRLSTSFHKTRGVDAGSMSVHVCVGFKALSEFLSHCEALGITNEKRPCAMATSLGHLAPPYNYLSWELTPDVDVETIGSELASRIRKDAAAFFRDYSDIDRAVQAWRVGIRYNLGNDAVLYIAAHDWINGRHDSALNAIKDAIISARLPSSRFIYSSFLEYLECLKANSDC